MWTLLLAAAVLWPGRVIGPLDGAPFDSTLEGLLLASALPALWYLAPGFLRTHAARVLTASLLAWKLAGWLLLTQTGWCATFLAAPDAGAAPQMQLSWDVRSLWSGGNGCTAILTRPYAQLEDFPAWTINILPESARPPAGMFALHARGVFVAPRAGQFRVVAANDAVISGVVDAHPFGSGAALALARGPHRVDVRAELHGSHWRFVPQWNDADLFSRAPTFVSVPTALDRVISGWGRWVTPALVGLLLLMWAAAALRDLQPGIATLVWTGVVGAATLALGAFVEPPLVRFSMLVLLAAAAVPIAERARTLRGAFLLVGVPWLAFFAGRALHDIGHFMVYTAGDDWWTFQRHAYRIFMEGFWFEGGEQTFWNQPLYRWIAGLLHLVFGDSSAGEMFLDAAGLVVGAMFAFDCVSRLVSFRFGLLAAGLVLNVAMLGPNWYGIGRGLSEISAALCVYLAAFALRGSRGRLPHVLFAGAFAALAFFTRLNHLLLLTTLVLLLVPESVTAGSVWHPGEIWRRLPKAASVVYLSCPFFAVLAISTRTWYYTDHFSLFLGTQRDLVSTGLGPSTIFSGAAWGRALESVAMIATVQDPPRLDPRVVVVTLGAAFALLGLLAAPIVRRLPFGLAVFGVGALAGGLVVRGSAYAGRFSVQLIPVATAVAVSSLALALGQGGREDEVAL